MGHDEEKPPPQDKNGTAQTTDVNLRNGRGERQVQLLRAGSLLLGIFRDEIASIADWRKPTPLPHSPRGVLGVVSIAGRMLTVLAPVRLVNPAVNDDDFSPTHIVVLLGDEQLGLAVEGIGEIIGMTAEQLQPSVETTERAVLGNLLYAGQLIRIVNLRELFRAAIQGRERRQRRF